MLIEILTLIYVLCITIPIVFWVFMSRDDSIFMTPYERMIKYESNYMRRIIPDDIMITTKWVESDYSNTRVMIFKRQYDNTCKSAIVLVHGGSSTSINAFGTMIKHLIDHYDIYTIDLPGYGISHITDNILPIESAPFLRIYTDILADVYRYLNLHDYSLSEISRIVESNDAKILSLYISSHTDSTKLEVTIKINRTDLSAIIQTFNRYNYTIKASFHQSEYVDDLKDRFDSFMSFLNI